MELPPFTQEEVRALPNRRPTADLHALTGGNPFYVGEVLATDTGHVPPSVADAVRARVQRHSAPAQRILAGAAVVGRPASAAHLAAVTGVAASAVDECV